VREDITYPSGPDQVKATLVRPKTLSGTAPAVIVIHEIFGLNDHIRDVAARLAQAGYVALAPDLYSREGGAPEATDFSVIRAFVSKIADDRIVGDLQAGAAYLMGHSAVGNQRKIGTVGFCMGGLYAMLFAAQTPSLGASVVYYGRIRPDTTPIKPVTPLSLMPRLQVPLQAHYGEADTGIPLPDVEALKLAIPAGVPNEIYTYPNAPHAFHNDTRPSYREQPAILAWSRTLAFFDRHLKADQ
jgi:carboxymethylenebutenolidase